MTTPIPQDELTSTICGAVQQLNHHKKANFLLDTSLALIETGQCVYMSVDYGVQLISFAFRYGPDVDNYLEVFLRTPGVSRRDMTKALLARGNARKQAGERLLAKAHEGATSPFVVWCLL
jgi:hypothetical protein